MQGILDGPGSGDSKVGRQIVLPLSRAFEIAWKGIKIRLWRSLITMSGIILAIAFLMSVWTSGVFTDALRDVPTEHELYPLVRGALEAEAIQSGGVKLQCAIVEAEDVASESYLSPGTSMLRLLNAQRAFGAELLPADAQGLSEMLAPGQPALPDSLILVRLPEALSDDVLARSIDQFVERGGFLLVYGGTEVPEAIQSLIPARVESGSFVTSGSGVTPSDHLAAQLVPWSQMPEATFTRTAGEGEALANTSAGPVLWMAERGSGSVAWFPVADDSAADTDVMAWFLRGQTVSEPGAGDPTTALLVKLLAYGNRRKLAGENVDRRGIWLVGLSLMVCVVGITNAMLMSVTERFREIGTMKCLGALDKFVVKLFLIESSLQGVVGSLVGAVIGFLLALARALFAFHVKDLETGEGYWLTLRFFPAATVLEWFLMAVAVGIVLSVVAAIYPALRAARMEPVQAMRAEA